MGSALETLPHAGAHAPPWCPWCSCAAVVPLLVPVRRRGAPGARALRWCTAVVPLVPVRWQPCASPSESPSTSPSPAQALSFLVLQRYL